jgi:hypothetical protein
MESLRAIRVENILIDQGISPHFPQLHAPLLDLCFHAVPTW